MRRTLKMDVPVTFMVFLKHMQTMYFHVVIAYAILREQGVPPRECDGSEGFVNQHICICWLIYYAAVLPKTVLCSTDACACAVKIKEARKDERFLYSRIAFAPRRKSLHQRASLSQPQLSSRLSDASTDILQCY